MLVSSLCKIRRKPGKRKRNKHQRSEFYSWSSLSSFILLPPSSTCSHLLSDRTPIQRDSCSSHESSLGAQICPPVSRATPLCTIPATRGMSGCWVAFADEKGGWDGDERGGRELGSGFFCCKWMGMGMAAVATRGGTHAAVRGNLTVEMGGFEEKWDFMECRVFVRWVSCLKGRFWIQPKPFWCVYWDRNHEEIKAHMRERTLSYCLLFTSRFSSLSNLLLRIQLLTI